MPELIRVDLFGQRVEIEARQVGRPRHVPTQADRQLVSSLVLAGIGQDAIARTMRISGPTLRLCYATELGSKSKTGARRDKREAKL